MAESIVPTEVHGIPYHEVGDSVVLVPTGPQTHANCRALDEACRQLLRGARPRVVLDCKAVALFDSDALDALATLHDLFEDHGASLRIIHLNEVCSDIFVATRLINLLHVYPDLGRALKGG